MATSVWRKLLYHTSVAIILGVLVVAIVLDEPVGEGVLVNGEVMHAASSGAGTYSLSVKTADGIVRVTSEHPASVGDQIQVRERRTSILRRKRHSID